MSEDGGPAFPQMRVWNSALGEYEDTNQYPGMSLRDWFASNAPEPSERWMQMMREIDRSKNPHNDAHKPAPRNDFQLIAEVVEVEEQGNCCSCDAQLLAGYNYFQTDLQLTQLAGKE